MKEVDEKEAEAGALEMLGYPMNNHALSDLFDLRCITSRHFISNNCGDPMGQTDKPWRTHTLQMENALLKKLMEPWGGTADNTWGYVTTGGTEGVMKGVHAGYERLKTRGYKKILIAWGATCHYSVGKAANTVGAEASCQKVVVDVTHKNMLNFQKLREVLEAGRHFCDAALVIGCLGTTFFGGCDDFRKIQSLMTECGYKHGDNAYVHMDAALNGGFWHLADDTPKYVIGKDFDSCSISGHKWFGGFVAGAVFVSRDKAVEELEKTKKVVEYVGMVDKFISGSRNGSSPVLWMGRLKQFDWKAELERCLENARFLESELKKIGIPSKMQYLNVLFPKPSPETCSKWQLMAVGHEAQVIVMPHVKRSNLEDLINCMKKDSEDGTLTAASDRLKALQD